MTIISLLTNFYMLVSTMNYYKSHD